MENNQPVHKRRVRYKGTHPRNYNEKYKELNPEKYGETIERVIQKGGTPAGMHISIMVQEILDFLQIQPGQRGLDATLGYGGHTSAMLKCLKGEGHLTALDVDAIEMAKTEERLRNQGFEPDILTIRRMNFANIDEVAAQAEAVHDVFKPIIKGRYIDYLLSHYDVEYSVFENCVNDFITENMLSLWDLKYLCNLGISGIRNENEEFKSKYRFIKKVHCAFIEYCMESMGIDPPSSYTDLRDEAYLYYKYQDNAVEYVENELGISAYECGKESVEFPVYECLECGAEQLVHDAKAQKCHCFSCGEDFDESTITFCDRCGAIMKNNEIDICPNCIENMTAK